MILYALTILVSAFLLFQVQPVIAKIILPWFGGSAAVWTTCLLFFQMVLLLGYLYSHAVIRYLKPRAQMLVHAGLLVVSALVLPIYPSASWKPVGGSEPTLQILGPAGGEHRTALLSALHYRSAVAGVVRAALPWRHAVPFVRAFQRGLACSR